MSLPTEDPRIGLTQIKLLESAAMNFFANSSTAVFSVLGDLCSVDDVTIGQATFYPLTVSNRNDLLQYLQNVKSLNWSFTYSYDDSDGNTESASESGTNYLVPLFFFGPDSVPSVPGRQVRRQMLKSTLSSALALRTDDGSDYITIDDAVTRRTDGVITSTRDLDIEMSIFGRTSAPDARGVAHDNSTGEYYPKFSLFISTGRTIESYQDRGHIVGTASIEDLGSCNIYANTPDITASFNATIASTF